MGYLICQRCGGYYKLQEGESPDDFVSCQCYGPLKYVESLDHHPERHKKLKNDSTGEYTYIDVDSDVDSVKSEDLKEIHEESDGTDSEDLEKEPTIKNRAYYRRVNYYSKPNIEKLKHQNDVGSLINALYYDDSEVKVGAVQALGVVGDERALKHLENIIQEESGTLRIYAEIAVNQIKAKKNGFKSQNRSHFRSNYRKIPSKTIFQPDTDEIKKKPVKLSESNDSTNILDSSNSPDLKEREKFDGTSPSLQSYPADIKKISSEMKSSSESIKLSKDKFSDNTTLFDETIDESMHKKSSDGKLDDDNILNRDRIVEVDRIVEEDGIIEVDVVNRDRIVNGEIVNTDVVETFSVDESEYPEHSIEESVNESLQGSLNEKNPDNNSLKVTGTSIQEKHLVEPSVKMEKDDFKDSIHEDNLKNIHDEPKDLFSSPVTSVGSKGSNITQTTLDHQVSQAPQIKTTNVGKNLSKPAKPLTPLESSSTKTPKTNTLTKRKSTSTGNLTKNNEATADIENSNFKWLNIKDSDKELIIFVFLFALVLVVGVILTMSSS